MPSGACVLNGAIKARNGSKSSTTTREGTPGMIINNMRPIHPGEILREEFLLPLGMTAHALAMAIRVPAPRIHDIVREKRSVSPDTALRLARYFGTTPEFWMNLQSAFDLRTARLQTMETIEREVHPRDVAA